MDSTLNMINVIKRSAIEHAMHPLCCRTINSKLVADLNACSLSLLFSLTRKAQIVMYIVHTLTHLPRASARLPPDKLPNAAPARVLLTTCFVTLLRRACCYAFACPDHVGINIGLAIMVFYYALFVLAVLLYI